MGPLAQAHDVMLNKWCIDTSASNIQLEKRSQKDLVNKVLGPTLNVLWN